MQHYQEDIKHTRRHAIQTTIQTTQDPNYNNSSGGDNEHRPGGDNYYSYDNGEIGGTTPHNEANAENFGPPQQRPAGLGRPSAPSWGPDAEV
jgi:hypothetical protein